MNDLRQTISWLLVAMVGAVGAGAAVLGISQAPSNVPLKKAVANTLAAPSYNEVVTQVAPQGTETDYLTYVAPSTLGGYIEESGLRSYVYVIGSTEYVSHPVPAGTAPKHLTFQKQQGPGAKAVDPLRHYLGFAATGRNITQNGGTYSFALSQRGQTGHFTYTVSGRYISDVLLTVATESVHVVVSQVGSAAHVALPKGVKIVSAPATPTPG